MDKVLVIDDDPAIHRVLRETFASSGFDFVTARDGARAMDIFCTSAPSVVILELRLPGISGSDLCREIRTKSSRVPILVLSSASDEFDKVLLLELGADDYITKPFSPRELLARVRASLRRLNQVPSPTDVFIFDDVVVNFLSMELFRAGKVVSLTPQEFRMLRFFVNNQGRVIPDSELLNEVCHERSHMTTGTIKTHILRLRQKLERNPKKPLHFLTVHRAGYKFVL
jgi:DNA-binding response OmpR family regulator